MITAEEVGTINPIFVNADESLAVAAAMMRSHRIHHLPVVDHHCMVGMLLSRDLVGMVPEVANRKGKPQRPEKPLDPEHHLTVNDVRSRHVLSIPCETTIHRAAWLMFRHKVRSLPMTRDNRVVGMLTDTDLLRACTCGIARIKGKDPTTDWRNHAVGDFMSASVWTIEPKASVLHAWLMMQEHDVRHLAVAHDDGLELVSGIVSDDDVFYALRDSGVKCDSVRHSESPTRMSLAEVMTPKVVTIGKSEYLPAAAEKMLSHDISALLVMDTCLEGIITRVDLLRAIVTMG